MLYLIENDCPYVISGVIGLKFYCAFELTTQTLYKLNATKIPEM